MMSDILNDNDYYRTGDLALAAAIARYYPVEAVDRHDRREVQYVFWRDARLDELVEQFWCGELVVEPQTYYRHLRILEALRLPAD